MQMLLLVGFGIFVMKLNWGREPLALFVILFSLRACRGGVRHHDGDIHQDRRSSQRIKHHVRHGLRA